MRRRVTQDMAIRSLAGATAGILYWAVVMEPLRLSPVWIVLALPLAFLVDRGLGLLRK